MSEKLQTADYKATLAWFLNEYAFSSFSEFCWLRKYASKKVGLAVANSMEQSPIWESNSLSSSLLCSQESASGPCPETDESSLHFSNLCTQDLP